MLKKKKKIYLHLHKASFFAFLFVLHPTSSLVAWDWGDHAIWFARR
jgi:hypothetical protein